MWNMNNDIANNNYNCNDDNDNENNCNDKAS